jgi:DNA-binding transcriptional regulator YdaS (Cro superfamily)
MLGPMNLAAFLERADRKLLAAKLQTHEGYLYQIATGRRKPGPVMARRIHEATLGVVTLESLRPDVWGAGRQVTKRG